MARHVNDCGIRNSFGFVDTRAHEIILKHPCFKKRDVEEVYNWVEDTPDLRKLSLGIGTIDQLVADDSEDTLYSAARHVIRQNMTPNSQMDNEILKNILSRAKNKPTIRNLSLKCYIFAEDNVAFDVLLQALRALTNLVYLDLSGCFFNDDQLLDLAEVIATSHIAHLVWPEPRMSELVMGRISGYLKSNHSLVVLRGVPLDFQKIAQENRNWLFSFGRRPTMIGDREAAIIREYSNSLRLGLAFEKQRLFDLEKAIEAVLA